MADYTYTPENNIFAGMSDKNPEAITVATGQGELAIGTLLISLAGADYIIADTTDTPTAADKLSLVVLAETIYATSAAVETIGYRSGSFDSNYLVFGGTDDASDWKDDARNVNIIFNTGAVNALAE